MIYIKKKSTHCVINKKLLDAVELVFNSLYCKARLGENSRLGEFIALQVADEEYMGVPCACVYEVGEQKLPVILFTSFMPSKYNASAFSFPGFEYDLVRSGLLHELGHYKFQHSMQSELYEERLRNRFFWVGLSLTSGCLMSSLLTSGSKNTFSLMGTLLGLSSIGGSWWRHSRPLLMLQAFQMRKQEYEADLWSYIPDDQDIPYSQIKDQAICYFYDCASHHEVLLNRSISYQLQKKFSWYYATWYAAHPSSEDRLKATIKSNLARYNHSSFQARAKNEITLVSKMFRDMVRDVSPETVAILEENNKALCAFVDGLGESSPPRKHRCTLL